MKRSIKRRKSVVFLVRQTRVLAYFPFGTSSKCRSLFSTCFPRHLWLLTNNTILESLFPARKKSCNSFNWLVSAAIFMANEKHMVLKSACDPSFGRSCWNNMARRECSIDVLKYIHFFRLSCNIQTLFYWGRKGEFYTCYHIRLISQYKDFKTKVVSWFSLVIRQNASRQLATSSENLVASVQFLVALATIESKFWALTILIYWKIHPYTMCLTRYQSF